MPRKKENARRIKRTRKLNYYKRAVIVPVDKRAVERMSPGILVAVAEWR